MVQQSKSLTRVKTDSNFQKCSRNYISSRFLINGRLYETQKNHHWSYYYCYHIGNYTASYYKTLTDEHQLTLKRNAIFKYLWENNFTSFSREFTEDIKRSH